MKNKTIIKAVNDSLYFGSVGLTLCFNLHAGDPSQLMATKSVVDALYVVGQRIEKRLDETDKR